ncbi:hypothetical protein HDU96_005018 [Phlyctochytrium bullatum]|nr:hypothetical protein HDU96_005018 [Phlyctochytrium bullatum]
MQADNKASEALDAAIQEINRVQPTWSYLDEDFPWSTVLREVYRRCGKRYSVPEAKNEMRRREVLAVSERSAQTQHEAPLALENLGSTSTTVEDQQHDARRRERGNPDPRRGRTPTRNRATDLIASSSKRLRSSSRLSSLSSHWGDTAEDLDNDHGHDYDTRSEASTARKRVTWNEAMCIDLLSNALRVPEKPLDVFLDDFNEKHRQDITKRQALKKISALRSKYLRHDRRGVSKDLWKLMRQLYKKESDPQETGVRSRSRGRSSSTTRGRSMSRDPEPRQLKRSRNASQARSEPESVDPSHAPAASDPAPPDRLAAVERDIKKMRQDLAELKKLVLAVPTLKDMMQLVGRSWTRM